MRCTVAGSVPMPDGMDPRYSWRYVHKFVYVRGIFVYRAPDAPVLSWGRSQHDKDECLSKYLIR